MKIGDKDKKECQQKLIEGRASILKSFSQITWKGDQLLNSFDVYEVPKEIQVLVFLHFIGDHAYYTK